MASHVFDLIPGVVWGLSLVSLNIAVPGFLKVDYISLLEHFFILLEAINTKNTIYPTCTHPREPRGYL